MLRLNPTEAGLKFDPKIHHRRSIRLKGYDYTQTGAYFVTLVTYHREEIFGKVVNGEMRLNNFGQIAKQQWEKLPHRFRHVEWGNFVIMPNHMHGIVFIVDDGKGAAESTHDKISESSRCALTAEDAQDFVSESSSASVRISKMPNVVAGSLGSIVRAYKSAVAYRINMARGLSGAPVWQRNYYEHIARNETEIKNIWDYIDDNPRRWEEDQLHPSAPRKGVAPLRPYKNQE
jgi:REP element-mobilizing transposase RayT